MKIFRLFFKTIAFILAFHMLMLSGPYQSALAAMIATDSILDENRSQRTRNRLDDLLAREDIRAELVSQGIDPQEAFGYRIIEPLIQLRKDGVRRVGEALGLPIELFERIPFPGPAK